MLHDETIFADKLQQIIAQNKLNQEEFKCRSEKFIKLNYPVRPNLIIKFMKDFYDIFIKLELLKSEKQVKIKLK